MKRASIAYFFILTLAGAARLCVRLSSCVPRHTPAAATVNVVLAGNLSNTFPISWRMQVFYLVAFLQRFIPSVHESRLTLATAHPFRKPTRSRPLKSET